MLRVSYIRAHKDAVIEGLKKRHFKHLDLVDQVLEADASRREIQRALDNTLAECKVQSREMGDLFKAGKREEAEALRAQSTALKARAKVLKARLGEAQQTLKHNLLRLPNIPEAVVKAGEHEADNEVLSQHGDIPELGAAALPHWELASRHGLFDLELGAKISGAGFPVYRAQGARLQRILIEYFLRKNVEAGYTEYFVPYFINEVSGYGTGQLPDKEGQMYHMEKDDLYATPTGEVPLMNCFRDVILDETALPIKATAHTPCFRREAGSYGKEVRGLNRLHQFEKVEIIQITKPEDSQKALEEMMAQVQRLLEALELPYRILRLCGGDMAFSAAETYDFEVYAAAQKRWLEVSSVSNTTDFQADSLRLRYRDKSGETTRCHALNGSALALSRIYAALLENKQTPEGIVLPAALADFSGLSILS